MIYRSSHALGGSHRGTPQAGNPGFQHHGGAHTAPRRIPPGALLAILLTVGLIAAFVGTR